MATGARPVKSSPKPAVPNTKEYQEKLRSVLQRQAQACSAAGRHDDAIFFLSMTLDSCADKFTVFFERACEYYHQKKYKKTILDLKKCLAIHCTPEVLKLLARCYKKLRNMQAVRKLNEVWIKPHLMETFNKTISK